MVLKRCKKMDRERFIKADIADSMFSAWSAVKEEFQSSFMANTSLEGRREVYADEWIERNDEAYLRIIAIMDEQIAKYKKQFDEI